MRLLSSLLALVGLAAAHTIQLRSLTEECFYEQLHADDKMTVTFMVGDREFGGSGNLEIDFWVFSSRRDLCKTWTSTDATQLQIKNPSGAFQHHEQGVSSGDHTFTAMIDGKYTYCFSNEHWNANSKEVIFNVHGIVYVPESEAPADPLEKEVRHLSELMTQVKDEQGYIVARERTHRNTAESTNARVKWWSLFQIIVLIGEGVFQVWWLKRFFEVSKASVLGR
ncbi:transmembrane emp24 domain-containing protein 2 precursor [Venturia nashicola]|uniref:Transmembrane emp24 domain-containing protein 2 n=1 Tax=Venturia nashicola TaxID=86259 RepID=A0A4Z1PG13_9PEZI|nr:transmembrane emp24 domain-containing protein 2 precursor [Venturia nashicola]TLD39305.1 transmembrane emp24 domain-containing protein 2 precursor [Venturia nashicola]